MASSNGWIGVDLDRTLAFYDEWRGVAHIGEPIAAMLERVRGWLAEGKDVRIFTARVSGEGLPGRDVPGARAAIELWCLKHLGKVLPVTCEKDFDMWLLWDDRCVQIEANTGRRMDGLP